MKLKKKWKNKLPEIKELKEKDKSNKLKMRTLFLATLLKAFLARKKIKTLKIITKKKKLLYHKFKMRAIKNKITQKMK